MSDPANIKRIGMVIGMKEDCIAAYRELHDGPGVRDLLNAANIRNFNIFLQKMPDGKFYEFAFYEYHGADYDGDMATLAKNPRNIAWLKQTDAMQVPLPGNTSWTVMQSIFFNP